MTKGEYTQTVWVCPRCNGEHQDAQWTPLPKPKTFLGHTFTHSTVCPATVEPLFMDARIV